MTLFYEFQIDIIKALQSVAQDWITAIVETVTMLGEEYIAIAVIAIVLVPMYLYHLKGKGSKQNA